MIDWLLQSAADLPAGAEWLSAGERRQAAGLKVEKRRREWLLGRWTAKRLVQAAAAQSGRPPMPLAAIEIGTCSDGAPALVAGAAGLSLSLSHSAGCALAALVPGRPRALGADLERIAPREPAFVADYFTPAEQAQVACASPRVQDLLATALWSAKEAALKAARLGLSVDTRAVECRLSPPSAALARWAAFEVRWDAGRLPAAPPLQGWWRLAHDFVLTLAASPLPMGDC